MLGQLRDVVCKLWEVVESLDSRNIGENIPFIGVDGDIRHAMKGEVIIDLLSIAGSKAIPNDEQIAFLQYVIHAPINNNNKKEYVKRVMTSKEKGINYIIPYLVLLDMALDNSLAENYLNFLSVMAMGYLNYAEEIGIDMILRYTSVMMKNKELIEIGYGKAIEYDPLSKLDAEKRNLLMKLYEMKTMVEEETDEEFLVAKQALYNVVNGISEDDQSQTEAAYRKFEESINNLKYKNEREDSIGDEDTDSERTIEEIKEELGRLIGLEDVKAQIHSIFNIVQIRKECEKRGINRQPMSFHMLFTGNPGTGKTTVARLVAEVFHNIGLLSKGHLVEVGRADLVGGYVGHTALKVQEVLQKAKGGVLFIDEAYSLVGRSENDFGHEAIETLVKGMEDNREDLVIIAAGYPEELERFINSNPGLASRFSKRIHFPDYTSKELTEIFIKFCDENAIVINNEIRECISRYFEVEILNKTKNFGNARMVRNYFEQVLMNQANRLVTREEITDEMLCSIVIEDISQKFFIDKNSLFKV